MSISLLTCFVDRYRMHPYNMYRSLQNINDRADDFMNTNQSVGKNNDD
ncbi:hypothetical protein LCGC14_0617990 [marine sediment metagenome]|uniref:Uncharacterized protein n=1 Tax=marine sediment metagenome TaxID=412755 RepID=A0A0F9UE79_9ZZZZ